MESENFRVHFNPGREKLSEKVLFHLEEARDLFYKWLGYRTRIKTEVLIDDRFDGPNGYAMVTPYPKIGIYPVPYESLTSIGEYDDWVRALSFHEYVHIVANDTTSGYSDILRKIFGTAFRPNQHQPLWLVEGLAVYGETRFGEMGRGRSRFISAVLRKMVERNLLASDDYLPIDRLQSGLEWWPAGLVPYNFGYILYEEAARVSGSGDVAGRISLENSGRIPYLINGNLRNVTGRDYYELYSSARDFLGARLRKEISEIRRKGVTETWRISKNGRNSGSPVLTPDGKTMYYIDDSPDDNRSIYSYSLAEKRHQKLTSYSKGGRRLSIDPSGRYLLYSKMNEEDNMYVFSDLFIYDLKEKKETRLSSKLRAREPSFASDSKSIVFVINRGDGNQCIAVSGYSGRESVTDANARRIFCGKNFERLEFPVFAYSDGKIVFSLKKSHDPAKLAVLDVRSGGIEYPVKTPAVSGRMFTENSPRVFIENGKESIVYSADYDGVRNIYTVPISGGSVVPRKTSNVIGAADLPFMLANDSGRRLFYSLYDVEGWDAAEQKNVKEGYSLLDAGSVKTVYDHYRGIGTGKSPSSRTGKKVEYETNEYSVFPSLFPRYWFPIGQVMPDGYIAGITTGGIDALERHQYDLGLYYDSRASFPLFDFQYMYTGMMPYAGVYYSQDNLYFSVTESSNRNVRLGGILSYPVDDWVFSAGIEAEDRRLADLKARNVGPTLSISHDTASGSTVSVTSNSGHQLLLRARHNMGKLGDESFQRLEFIGTQYFPGVFSDNTIRLNVVSGYSNNDNLVGNYNIAGGSYQTISRNFLLRGYPDGVLLGRKMLVGNVEYGFLISSVRRGAGTLPFFLEKIWGRLFTDAGAGEYLLSAETGGFSRDRMKTVLWSAGAEILLDCSIFYGYPFNLVVGYHHGHLKSSGGDDIFYLGFNMYQ